MPINDNAAVKLHLRIEDSIVIEDSLITIYSGAAEEWIRNYIDDEGGVLPGEMEDPVEEPPFSIKAAHLLLVADMYLNREAASEIEIHDNPAVTRLIHPYRACLGV